MMASSHRVLNDCTVLVRQFDLEYFIEVQNRFVRVADLEVLVVHPCDLLCSLFFNKTLSLDVSVDG